MTKPLLPILIESSDLNTQLNHEKLLIVDLSSESSFSIGHIPGAVYVSPRELVRGQPPAPGLLPSLDRLEALFSRLGLTEDTHVVAYDDEGGGWAGRFIWTLDVIGHKKYSYLNGGILAWRAEGLPQSREINTRPSTPQNLSLDPTVLVSKEELIQLISENITIWDARSPEEYLGQKQTALRNGHMPGAINGNWTDLMDSRNNLRLREDLDEYLSEKGFTPGKPIITHCQSHHRSGLTYLVGKLKGLNIRAYPGSWSEWGNSSDTPII